MTISCSVMSDSLQPHETVAYQAPLSMAFYRQEYWSGLPCPPPEDLSDPGIEPASHVSPALPGGFFTTEEAARTGTALLNSLTKCESVTLSVVSDSFLTPLTVACQAPLSMGFSRQEYWSGLPFPSPGDLPDSGLNGGLLHCRQIFYCLSRQGSPLTKTLF